MSGARQSRLAITIGGVSVAVCTSDDGFLQVLRHRYAAFAAEAAAARCDYEFDVDLHPEPESAPDEDVRVFREGAAWKLQRGDFRAEWDPAARRGRVRQSANPYSIDTVLRIVHTLVLAQEGGFLMHAASAICDGRACVFAGVSGAGKTTLASMAPPGVQLLSDEISYVRKIDGRYFAYGTPFAGELGRPGDNVRAPLAAVYLLSQATVNSIRPVGLAQAASGLLANTLFFAQDAQLVQAVFHAALDLCEAVTVATLDFRKDPGVWDLIRRTHLEQNQ